MQEVDRTVPEVEVPEIVKTVPVEKAQVQERSGWMPHCCTGEKAHLQERVVETPQARTAEKVLEAPQVQVREVIGNVPRLEVQEVIREALKIEVPILLTDFQSAEQVAQEGRMRGQESPGTGTMRVQS